MNPTTMIHDLVRTGRITPSDGAMLMAMRAEIRMRRQRQKIMRAAEMVGIVMFTALAISIVGALADTGLSWWAVPSVIIGYALADLLTGIAHWFGDNIGQPNWPVIGAHFIQPFRDHHVDQTDITRHDFVETNGNNALLACPMLGLLVVLVPFAPNLVAGLAACVFAVAATNQIHKWAHLECLPRIITALQRFRVILSPAVHAHHHRPPHTQSYCVTSGWMSPVLDWLLGRKPAYTGHQEPK